jgi:threonine dehydrogenase-like Zn-dependent dehydrogenase
MSGSITSISRKSKADPRYFARDPQRDLRHRSARDTRRLFLRGARHYFGHEAVGVVEEVGSGVRNFRKGNRVVVPATIRCGNCSYCRCGYHPQCDNSNPNGKLAGTVYLAGRSRRSLSLDCRRNTSGCPMSIPA